MQTATRKGRAVVGMVGAAALVLVTSIAGLARPAAAASFVNRGLTLPGGVFELGLGLGLGHTDAGVTGDYTGLGVNMELGYGLSSKLELRFRTGLRFGDEGRATNADYFGHPVETESYNAGWDTLRNPEIGLRFDLVGGGTAEVGLDARLYLPVDEYFGFLFGVPVALHLGNRLRLDTGIFIPFILADPDTRVDISLPLHLWIRLDGGTFFGPMTGLYFHDGGGESVPFGIGFGTALAYDADLRFWLLFPDVSRDGGAKDFGTGVGLYVTF
jgi:hypothetical protein